MTRIMLMFNLSLKAEYLAVYTIHLIKDKCSFLKEQRKVGKRK